MQRPIERARDLAFAARAYVDINESVMRRTTLAHGYDHARMFNTIIARTLDQLDHALDALEAEQDGLVARMNREGRSSSDHVRQSGDGESLK